MNIDQIKADGREAFKNNYWKCVLVALLLSLLSFGTTNASGRSVANVNLTGTQAEQEVTEALGALTQSEANMFMTMIFGGLALVLVASFLLRIFLFNPLQVGGYRFFKRNLTEEVDLGVVGEGFGGYGHTFVTLLLRDIFLYLWSLLFIIPGIIKAYSYMLVPYLLKDNPELSATETITRSKELMKGHKGDAFAMDLSFIGWFLLGLVTANLVNIFWTNPYHESARAKFYTELINGRVEVEV